MAITRTKAERVALQDRQRKGPDKHETGKDNSSAATVRKSNKPKPQSDVPNKVERFKNESTIGG
jgi:hypothetical protein